MKIWLKDLIWRFTLTLAHGILINQFHKIGLLESCTDTNPTDSSPEHWSAMGAAQTKTTWPDSIDPFWWVMDRMENLCQKKMRMVLYNGSTGNQFEAPKSTKHGQRRQMCIRRTIHSALFIFSVHRRGDSSIATTLRCRLHRYLSRLCFSAGAMKRQLGGHCWSRCRLRFLTAGNDHRTLSIFQCTNVLSKSSEKSQPGLSTAPTVSRSTRDPEGMFKVFWVVFLKLQNTRAANH